MHQDLKRTGRTIDEATAMRDVIPTVTLHMDIAQWKPMLAVELSGVFEVRAAMRYRLQYDSWLVGALFGRRGAISDDGLCAIFELAVATTGSSTTRNNRSCRGSATICLLFLRFPDAP
jgi:hypothetical protein